MDMITYADTDVVVVGAGSAGLSCAYELSKNPNVQVRRFIPRTRSTFFIRMEWILDICTNRDPLCVGGDNRAICEPRWWCMAGRAAVLRHGGA